MKGICLQHGETRMSRLANYLKRLGIEPRDISIYRRALTHISAAGDPSESYERLEFLGDAILGLVISEFLFKNFRDKEEGNLSRIRSMVVSQEPLAEKALEMKLQKHLRVDTVRVREGGGIEESILADAFESMVGAVFADRGYLQAKAFVLRNLRDECIMHKDLTGPTDYKSRLQEFWQHRYKNTPDYEVVKESGPDHDKMFTIEVRYGRKVLGKGSGHSKKKAEQEAAREAYERVIEKETKKASKPKRK